MKKPLLIGAHTSTAGGCYNGLVQGKQIGATTVQIFTSNQKQWKGRSIPLEEISKWNALKEETGIQVVMSHDSYLINLGSNNPELLEKSKTAFTAELERCHTLGIDYLNFHPGAYTTGTEEGCLDQIALSLIECANMVKKGSTLLVLETTAGQGTCVGHRFEQIKYIIDKVHPYLPIGVCIDTCHIFAAGYDIRTKEALDATLKEFDEVIGLKYLKALHINDSLKPLGSRVDRHASLGKGEIGLEGFKCIMQHPLLSTLPMYLETPDPELWPKEIELLRSYSNNLVNV
ncbi:MAG: deoxyribonuclease IV [Chlamydiae bacterium]|nr:deoxyribonuclease IV [Chlamydiota bacterium]